MPTPYNNKVSKFTTKVLCELNRAYMNEGGTSFTDALVQTKSSGLERKKTKVEKNKEKRDMQKHVVKMVNESFSKKAALTLLTEGESKRKYHRKRLAQSFCSPEEQPLPKRKKTHSPDFETVEWDTGKLLTTLQNWQTNTLINWSKVGRDHGIQGGNAGQVAKEFAIAHEIDIASISPTTPNRKSRSSKIKLPGYNVSIPCNPPISSIEAEIESLITSGHFALGEECAPYRMTKYVPINGKMTPQDTIVQARKIPLMQLRQKLLKKHLKYMRLTPKSAVSDFTTEEVTGMLRGYDCDSMSKNELDQTLFHAQRSRSLCMWHDHATMLKMGFIMITVHIMYDPIVFYTDAEYLQQNPGADISVQSEVEQPEIYLLAAGSSCVEDQAALIGDRIDCLSDLSIPTKTEDGSEFVIDSLRFFTGDHPATQFEQGSKQGGTFKCAVCGCNECMFDDQAHSLNYNWRTPQHLQALATAGIFGKQPGVIRPFDSLKVNDLRSELKARGSHIIDKAKKNDLQKSLDLILRGVARVPALLLTNPTQSLSSLNLAKYEIAASEPLHDLKGHLINLITELPYTLPSDSDETSTKCTHLISCCLAKEKKSGADIRRVIIQIFLLLKDLECSQRVILLLQTIIKIGEISYSKDDQRSPRQLLQLYNTCWIHMELCKDLFCTPNKISRSKMFGHYVHAITAHSPIQYELASLRSLNTENQERLFGQARAIAEQCTNHHPDNIIPEIILRLQANQERRIALLSVRKGDSQVSHVAKELPPLLGTTVKKSFLKHREDSWQLHLQRISPFLASGKGVWWTSTDGGFHFLDGDGDCSQMEAPSLLHFRQHSIRDIEERSRKCWARVIEERISIPANNIKVFDSKRDLTGRIKYGGERATYECVPGSSTLEEDNNYTTFNMRTFK